MNFDRLQVLQLTALEAQFQRWHESRFDGGVDLAATFRKLGEEVGELGEALIAIGADLTGRDAVKIEEEAADCAIVLAHIVRAVNGNAAGSLVRAMQLKFNELNRRPPRASG